MAKKKSILSEAPGYQYDEKAPVIKIDEFQKVVNSRRAVRIFEDSPIPDDVVRACLEDGLRAPNSSNLQPWEFYRVVTPSKRKALAYACFSQTAAKTAAELIVVAARTSTWREHAREMVDLFNRAPEQVAPSAFDYYRRIVPFAYTLGPIGVAGFFKRFLYFFIGLRKPIIREPVTRAHLRTWAVKSTALAAENIMLSFRARGYDTCPMEGYDSKRVKKVIGLPRDGVVVMVIAAGRRAKGGIYGPRIRFKADRFIKTV